MTTIADETLADFLDSLASKSPAPGGGAAASVAGATAASLAGMVLAYSVAKKSLAEHRDTIEAAIVRTRALNAEMLRLADEDAEAYAALNALQRLAEDDPRRLEEEPAAVARAVAAPRAVLDGATGLLDLLESLVRKTNPHLRSDLAIAAVLAEAAVASAAWNVRINTPLLPEPERAPLLGRMETAVKTARGTRDRIEKACL